MADMSVETSRICDVVRNSKIRSDISSMLNQSSDSFLLGPFQGLAEQRHRRTRDVHRVGRDFPRVSADEVVRKVLPCNSREENKRLDFNFKFDESESWVHGWNGNEDPFNEFYDGYSDSDSLIVRFKRNLPAFDGFWHTEDLMTWIDAIEDFFEETNPPEHLKCKIVSYKMKGAAYYWWKQLQHEKNEHGNEEISSWPGMKNLLLNRFSPTKCLIDLPIELNSNRDDEKNDGGPLEAYSSNHGVHDVHNMYDGSCYITAVTEIELATALNTITKCSNKDNLCSAIIAKQGVEMVKHQQDNIPMLTYCSMKVHSQLISNGQQQIEDWSSEEEFHPANSSINDVPKVVIPERPYSAIEVKQREGVVADKHLKADIFIPTTCSTKPINQLNIHGTSAGRPSNILIANFDPGGNCLGKLKWFWQHAFLLHNLELKQPLMEESQLELLVDLNTAMIKNPTVMRGKSTEQREHKDVKEMIHMNFDPGGKWPAKLSIVDRYSQTEVVVMRKLSLWPLLGGYIRIQVVFVAPCRLAVGQVTSEASKSFTWYSIKHSIRGCTAYFDAYTDQHDVQKRKLLIDSDVFICHPLDSNENFTSLIYGEYMATVHSNTRRVLFLFDPGGIFCSLRTWSDDLWTAMIAKLMSFRSVHAVLKNCDWNSDVVLEDKIVHRCVPCFCEPTDVLMSVKAIFGSCVPISSGMEMMYSYHVPCNDAATWHIVHMLKALYEVAEWCLGENGDLFVYAIALGITNQLANKIRSVGEDLLSRALRDSFRRLISILWPFTITVSTVVALPYTLFLSPYVGVDCHQGDSLMLRFLPSFLVLWRAELTNDIVESHLPHVIQMFVQLWGLPGGNKTKIEDNLDEFILIGKAEPFLLVDYKEWEICGVDVQEIAIACDEDYDLVMDIKIADLCWTWVKKTLRLFFKLVNGLDPPMK